MKKVNDFPLGWNDERVQEVIRHYESQAEDEAITEREAAFEQDGLTVMVIPTELVSAVRELLVHHGFHDPVGSAATD